MHYLEQQVSWAVIVYVLCPKLATILEFERLDVE